MNKYLDQKENELNELLEALECAYFEEDVFLLIEEIKKVENEVERLTRNNGKNQLFDKKEKVRFNYNPCFIKDKKKHGCYRYHHKSNRKRTLQSYANKLIRNTDCFKHKGKHFKKVFNVLWEMD